MKIYYELLNYFYLFIYFLKDVKYILNNKNNKGVFKDSHPSSSFPSSCNALFFSVYFALCIQIYIYLTLILFLFYLWHDIYFILHQFNFSYFAWGSMNRGQNWLIIQQLTCLIFMGATRVTWASESTGSSGSWRVAWWTPFPIIKI